MFVYICTYFHNPFAFFMQVIQQVYVVEEWVRNAHKEVKVEANSCLEIEKAFGALKQEQVGLSKKLKEAI